MTSLTYTLNKHFALFWTMMIMMMNEWMKDEWLNTDELTFHGYQRRRWETSHWMVWQHHPEPHQSFKGAENQCHIDKIRTILLFSNYANATVVMINKLDVQCLPLLANGDNPSSLQRWDLQVWIRVPCFLKYIHYNKTNVIIRKSIDKHEQWACFTVLDT